MMTTPPYVICHNPLANDESMVRWLSPAGALAASQQTLSPSGSIREIIRRQEVVDSKIKSDDVFVE